MVAGFSVMTNQKWGVLYANGLLRPAGKGDIQNGFMYRKMCSHLIQVSRL